MEYLAPRSGEAVLRLPLEELASRTDRDLEERDLFRQAARSALYGPRWRAAGAKLSSLHGRAALRQLPFVDGNDLVAMSASGASIRKALLTRPRTWVTSRGAPGVARKWLPLTLDDVAHWFRRAQRVLDVAAEHDREAGATFFLAINEPMPRVANAVPYLWERTDYLAGRRRFEFLIAATSMLWRNHWDRFALQKHPGWLAGSVADARLLAGELGDEASRLMAPPAKGIFWGEPLEGPEGGGRAELQGLLGLSESFSLYLSAECREMYAECPAHAGLHLWMDGTIHEVVPEAGEALFVDQAPVGTEGEYVVTTLGEALPLVRYRTGDRIRVEATEPCACGITHPRVRFLGRVDEPPPSGPAQAKTDGLSSSRTTPERGQS
jgi:phenylacetate-coenzyme A ligase PaaK-like adenylate-forming protein